MEDQNKQTGMPQSEQSGTASISYEPAHRVKHRRNTNRLFFFSIISASVSALAASLLGIYLLVEHFSEPPSGAVVVYKGSTLDPIRAGTPAEVYAGVADTVVEIRASGTVTGAGGAVATVSGAGSGVIYGEDGTHTYIITNHHVLDGYSSVRVRLTDGRELTAETVGTDFPTDIAVLRVKTTGLSLATVGDSDSLHPGQEVVAIGNPLGTLGGSITDGLVSGPVRREVNVGGVPMSLIQSSTPVSPGNSGGGLFNMYGELVGIVNAKYAAENVEGISFAIPMTTVTEVADTLIAQGYVGGRAALGLVYDRQLVSGIGGSAYRILVASNRRHDEALGENQILTGECIVRIGNTDVSDVSDIRSALSRVKVGDEVEVTVLRTVQTTVQTAFGPILTTSEKSYTFTVKTEEYKGESLLTESEEDTPDDQLNFIG